MLAVVFTLLVQSLAAWGEAPPSPRPRAQKKRLAVAADKTFREGVHGKLPPHLSTLLGISAAETECPVMQSVERAGTVVRGFDVSVANKNDIVLFVVEETANDQMLYLSSPDGILRKVVSVTAGVGRVVRITDTTKKAFEKEKQFWLNRLSPSRGK